MFIDEPEHTSCCVKVNKTYRCFSNITKPGYTVHVFNCHRNIQLKGRHFLILLEVPGVPSLGLHLEVLPLIEDQYLEFLPLVYIYRTSPSLRTSSWSCWFSAQWTPLPTMSPCRIHRVMEIICICWSSSSNRLQQENQMYI